MVLVVAVDPVEATDAVAFCMPINLVQEVQAIISVGPISEIPRVAGSRRIRAVLPACTMCLPTDRSRGYLPLAEHAAAQLDPCFHRSERLEARDHESGESGLSG